MGNKARPSDQRTGKLALIQRLRDNHGLSRNKAERVVNDIFDYITSSLLEGKLVCLYGCCSLELRPAEERTWTMRTGKVCTSKSTYRLHVSASEKLVQACRAKREAEETA